MIESKAIIQSGAVIGKGSSIGAYSFIGKDVVIGKNNIIDSYVVIDGYTTIGDNNKIDNHTVLGTAPQDSKSGTDDLLLTIGDHNHIGSHVFITAGTDHGGSITRIENNNCLKNGIHIGHDVQMGSHCIMEEEAALGGHVIVGDYTTLGKDASVHQFVTIGSYAALEEHTALTQDLPPYCLATGNRAKITGLHRVALEKYFSSGEIIAIQKAYAYLFTEGSPKKNAATALETETAEMLQLLYRFIVDSKRGVPFKRKTDVN